MKRSLVLLCLLLATNPISVAAREKTKNGTNVFVGQAPPEISATKWYHGASTSLAECKGKVVVLDFFWTWCPPCREVVPHHKQLIQAYKKRGVVFIALSDEQESVVERAIKNWGMDYLIGVGTHSIKDYGINEIPYVVIIGRDGKVRWTQTGLPLKGLDDALREATRPEGKAGVDYPRGNNY